MKPVVEYDPAANAAYIRFAAGEVADSAEVSEGIVFEYDGSGHIIGMEVLDARKHLPPEALTEAA